MMHFSTRTTSLGLAAALFGASAVISARASVTSQPATPAGQTGQPAPAAATAPAANGTPPARLAANLRQYRDGSYTGPSVDAYYGLVQVRANVQGGRVASVNVLQYPSDRRTSRSINARALPRLESEVISAQSATVDAVSGATLTSDAYLRSIRAALRQAGS